MQCLLLCMAIDSSEKHHFVPCFYWPAGLSLWLMADFILGWDGCHIASVKIEFKWGCACVGHHEAAERRIWGGRPDNRADQGGAEQCAPGHAHLLLPELARPHGGAILWSSFVC